MPRLRRAPPATEWRGMNHRTRTIRGIAAVGALVLAGGSLAACGDDDSGDEEESGQESAAEVTISDPWARTGTAGGNSAAYMEITGGTEASVLVAASASADVAAEVQIHETTSAGGSDDMSAGDTEGAEGPDDTSGDDMGDDTDMSGEDMEGMEDSEGDSGSGMMTMQEVSEIEIPAGETVSLEPGGYHVMLLDLASDLAVGDSIEVTLTFGGGYTETVTAEVRES
jgi:copper(I)-binding protein